MQQQLVAAITVIITATISSCSSAPPHVLFVLVDDLGWSDVGYHKISPIQTPNIDKLASEGVILDNYYVQPICSPTRSALLSGRYPIHTGMQHGVIWPTEPYGLPLHLTTLPQQLKKAGYVTHMVGKWHLGMYKSKHTPTYRGFDTFYGNYLEKADHWTFENLGILDLHDQDKPGELNMDDTYSAHIYSERAKKVIQAHDPSKPFFLYLSFLNAHAPAQAPERFTNKYNFIKDEPRRQYAGMVTAVDEAIGNVTEAMRKKGLWKNTLMIFSSDNGGIPIHGGYNWPLRGYKTMLWEGGIKAAAFVHGEMIQNKGSRCKELLHVTDWYPTLATLAGLRDKEISSVPDVQNNTWHIEDTSTSFSALHNGINLTSLDGMNVWDTISKGAPSPRQEILINIDLASHPSEPGQEFRPDNGIALRAGDMKLLLNVPNITWFKPPELGGVLGPYEGRLQLYRDLITEALYNITADPEERHDLSSKFPDVVTKLRQRVDFYMKSVVPSVKKRKDPKGYVVAKQRGYWGPWKNSD